MSNIKASSHNLDILPKNNFVHVELAIITKLYICFRTPLMAAVAHGHTDAVMLLIGMGATIDAADVYHRTALHRGVSQKDMPLMTNRDPNFPPIVSLVFESACPLVNNLIIMDQDHIVLGKIQ